MAITQTEAQAVVIGRKVGIVDERMKEIKAAQATITDAATLRTALNKIGYYDEKADQLITAGLTVTP